MNTHKTKVIVVDDDAEIRNLVMTYLSEEGFVVYEAGDGDSMRVLISRYKPDAVLLDIKMPGEDGLTLARQLREAHPRMVILMISGKEDVVDRVAGLEVGADDYIVKPLHLRELLARLRSVLRRRDIANGEAPAPNGSTQAPALSSPGRRHYRFSGWTLDGDRRTLVSGHGKVVDLTSGEFDLLSAFVAHPNRALTRDQLLDYARHRDSAAFDRSIDVQVGRLRRKIEQNPKRPALIKTVRNVGYMLCGDVTVHDGRHMPPPRPDTDQPLSR